MRSNLFRQRDCRQGRTRQFANISCRYFLKRPFGIYSVDTVNNTFTIGVRETGKGTKDILASRIGDTFLVLGPLGTWI
jgi:NAD(P)H-flavin reductase